MLITLVYKNKSNVIEKKIVVNKNITIKEIKKNYLLNNNVILTYYGQILKNNYTIGQYINKNDIKIYCINKIARKIIKIKIDLSFYVNKSIVMEIYNDVTVKEIKLCVIDYLKIHFPFLNEIAIIFMVDNNYLCDNKKVHLYNLNNKTIKLFLLCTTPFGIDYLNDKRFHVSLTFFQTNMKSFI